MPKAMFGAGSFWSAEAAFRRVPGVRDTVVGFSGGHIPDPTYEQVAGGGTGHSEVVLVVYDSRRLAYAELLERFWSIHDPTEGGADGADGASPRRSVIFYFAPAQRRLAELSRRHKAESGAYPRPIRTKIVPAGPFYPAEPHHQRYLEMRGLVAKSLFRD